jgi:hypothetical protein
MSLPWYVTVFLFLLSPVYAIVVRDKLWPRIQDRLATRSQEKLRKRIAVLGTSLSKAELLPLHTDVEHHLFTGIQAVLLLIGMGVHLIIGTLFFLMTTLRTVLLKTYGMTVVVEEEFVFLAFLIVNMLFLLVTVYGVRSYSQPRSEKWRARVQHEITVLRSKLR